MSTIREIYVNYCNKFTQLFNITGNGSIEADNKTLSQINDWIANENIHFLILSLTGLQLKGNHLH